MITTISLVIVCHRTKLLQYCWLIPHAVCFIPVTHLFVTGTVYLLISLTCFSHPPPPSLWQPPVFSLYLWLCFCFVLFVHLFWFLDLHISEIIQYLPFSVWFISLSIIPSRSIRVVANGKISFSFMARKYSSVYIYIPHLLYSFIYWWTHRLTHIMAIANNSAMNIGVHVYFQICTFITFACIPSSGIEIGRASCRERV